MHGLGNDFVVIDAVRQRVEMTPELARRLADRRRGIGCDQVLLVEPAADPRADFRYRIFNADGGEVEQCGNGARCLARFVVDEGLWQAPRLVVETRGGLVGLFLEPDGQVRVDMGPPRLEPAEIPIDAPARALRYPLEVEGERVEVGAVSMGNPHAVLEVADVAAAPVGRLGPALQRHPAFPAGVNVGFLQVLSPEAVRLRVYERGAGETEACGSGACAAVVWGRLAGRLGPRVRVHLRGGDLVIHWPGEGEPVWMTGPAERVFEGRIRT
ncbi:diaminopimelate epimerase [Inmirania thermothiophila]|nr:diaminopimelate epimerase [Inmirania thermothiophila]